MYPTLLGKSSYLLGVLSKTKNFINLSRLISHPIEINMCHFTATIPVKLERKGTESEQFLDLLKQMDDADKFGNLKEENFIEKPGNPFTRHQWETSGSAEIEKSATKNEHQLSSDINERSDRSVDDDSEEFGSMHSWSKDDIHTDIDGDNVSDADNEWREEESRPYVRRNHPYWFYLQLKKLRKAGKVKESIALIEEQMVSLERQIPTALVYTTLIGTLGRVGYTSKAFTVFTKMKQRGVKPTPATYTALFNACAESPFKQDALKRAVRLRQYMDIKSFLPNELSYHAMIKAFGKLGDLETAFSIIDEMIASGFRVNVVTFNNLLIACCSDTQAGLKHAIEVVRMMKRKQVVPDINTYNLLLRCIRLCALGPSAYAQELLANIDQDKRFRLEQKLRSVRDERYRGGSGRGRRKVEWWEDAPPGADDAKLLEETLRSLREPASTSAGTAVASIPATTSPGRSVAAAVLPIPNLLDPRSRYDGVTQIQGELVTAHERLQLFGGLNGFLHLMSKDMVVPDLKTITQLVEIIGYNKGDISSELSLLMQHIRENNIALDSDFCNLMIKANAMKGDDSAARDLIEFMQERSLKPNIQTFGCLALTCRNLTSAQHLIEDMQNAGFMPNVIIFGALCSQASHHNDYYYLLYLLQQMEHCRVRPDKRIISKMETAFAKGKKVTLQKERGDQTVRQYFYGPYFMEGYKEFGLFYKGWLLRNAIASEEHPWVQYGYQLRAGHK